MSKQDIINRIDALCDAHAYSLIKRMLLSDGQRICLSQERAAWLQILASEAPEVLTPRYVIPKHLNVKVEQIAYLIQQQNWEKPILETSYF